MKLMLLALLSATLISCTRVTVQPSAPTPVPVVTNVNDTVSFRVIGNALGARVRFSNSLDGLNQTTTTLPFQEIVTFKSDGSFLFIEATATGYNATVVNPFLSVQILVNGTLFREASTNSFFNETISASGTYRR